MKKHVDLLEKYLPTPEQKEKQELFNRIDKLEQKIIELNWFILMIFFGLLFFMAMGFDSIRNG